MNEELEIEVAEGYKRCSTTAVHGCGKVKPVSEFSKAMNAKDGYLSICKECDKQRKRRYHEEIKSGERKHIIVKTKRCPCCEITFDNPYEAFSTYPNRIDKLGSMCRKCESKRDGRSSAIKRARKKGILFDVTLKYWRSVYRDNCPACGVKLQYGGAKMCNNSATMDRLIPSKGYVEGNLMCLCAHCNEMKLNDDSSETLRARAKLVVKAHNYMADVMEAAEKGEYKLKVMAQGTLFEV